MTIGDGNRRGGAKPVALAAREHDWLRGRFEVLPRPFRFLAVGGVGLLTDLSLFTAIPMHAAHPIATRCVSLAIATLVTWRLNRALTFEASGRAQHEEAMRYAGVTLMSQGTSFAVFSALVLTVMSSIPQLALVAGAAAGAGIAYAGHFFYAFAPRSGARDTDGADSA